MAYLRESAVRAMSRRPIQLSEGRSRIHKSITDSVKSQVFLSHSHHDADLLETVEAILGLEGVDLYVDWRDSSMPQVTSEVTGVRLREKICRSTRLVVVASNKAITSRWVPWELGYGDGTLSLDSVAILPLSDDNDNWKGAEYLGLYNRILSTTTGFGVFRPGQTNGTTLRYWLTDGLLRSY